MANILVGLLVVIFPISHISSMPQQMFGIVGVNPVNLVWLITFLMIALNLKSKKQVTGTYFLTPGLVVFLMAFFIAVLWTALTVKTLKVPPGYPPYTSTSVLISNFFKPLQVLLTGWLIYRHCLTHGYQAMEKSVIMIPIIMLPFVIYYYFFGQVTDLSKYSEARDALSSNIGLHANELGGTALIILAYTINRKVALRMIEYVSVVAALLVIVFSLSRMAFLGVAVIMLLSFPSLTIRQRITVSVLGGMLLLALSPLIISRIEFGMEDSKKISINTISANRIDYLWKPSLAMIAEQPVIGQGYLSIWKGKSYEYKGFRLPTHPHSAYLQVALDLGIIGVMLLIWLLVSMIRTAIIRNSAMLYALAAWLLMGLTGLTFYPEFITTPIWILYGISRAKPLVRIKSINDKVSTRGSLLVS